MNTSKLSSYAFGALMANIFYDYTGLLLDKMVTEETEEAAQDMQRVADALVVKLEGIAGRSLERLPPSVENQQQTESENRWWFLDIKEWQKLDFSKLNDPDEIHSRETQLFFTALKGAVATVAFLSFAKISEPFFREART